MVLINKYLRCFFRRDSLLDVVREDLPKREVRSDVHVSGRNETVLEVVHSFYVKTRTTLIRMFSVGTWSKDAILNYVETGVEKRTRVRPRPQITTKTESALCIDIATEGEVCRATKSLVVRRR